MSMLTIMLVRRFGRAVWSRLSNLRMQHGDPIEMLNAATMGAREREGAGRTPPAP